MTKRKIIIIVATVCLLLSACAAPAEIDTVDAAQAAAETSAVDTPEPEPAETEMPDLSDGVPVIDEMMIVDVTLNLKNIYDIPEGSWSTPSKVTKMKAVSSSLTYDDGIEIAYDLRASKNLYVSYVIYSIYGYGIIDADQLREYAANYIATCATVPYASGDAAAAQQWVWDNLDTAIAGEMITTTIGNAEYILYGNDMFVDLEVRALGLDDYLQEVARITG